MSTLINATSLGNIIIVTGSFLLLLVLVKLFAWEQITGIFAAREEKIANDIDGAENARQEAETLSQAKAEAGQIVEEAKEAGNHKSEQIVAEARDEATRLKEKASQDIEQSKAEALSSVKEEVADLTILLAEKIMTANLDKEAQSGLINSYLDKLGDA